ncbi:MULTISPECIES: hypothetical protein [Sphingomonas]|uniref:hypothetical protein n=1 Tax=Sphingomonas TaxID=13687 RepID=UPI000DEF0326|nr:MULTISPECIES: hypothetical protein [Sphingomonas]
MTTTTATLALPTAKPWPRPAVAPLSALVAGLTILSLLPLLLIRYPAEVDYYNHLARMGLIADWWRGVDNPFYAVRWQMLPNLAADLIVPPLGLLIGVEAALKLFAVAAKLMIVTGAVALERVVRGRHLLAGLFALLVLFNWPFSWGVVNFEFGLGVALWGVAAWVSFAGRPLIQRAAVHTGVVGALFLSHFLALGIYGVTIGLLELARWSRPATRLRPARTVALLAVMAAPVALLLALTRLSGGAIGGTTTVWAFGFKWLWPLLLLNADLPMLSAAMMLGLLLWLGILVARRRLSLTREGAFVAGGLLLLYVAMPRQLFETDMIDIRLLVPLFLIVPAFVSLEGWSARARRHAALALTVLILVNLAVTATSWRSVSRDAAELRAAVATLPPGSRLLVARAPGAAERYSSAPIVFVPTLAVHDIHAFTPSLYTMPGVQPVAPRPAVAPLHIDKGLDYRLPPFALLAGEVRRPGSSGRTYLADWPHAYDALVLIGPPVANPWSDRLRPVAATAQATIYRLGN